MPTWGTPAILHACVDAANREAAESVAELEATPARHREELGPLTAGIRRLIEVMKQEDLPADDIKDEYRRLVREKERLQARCDKLEIDLERRRKRVLDADLIRRALQDFERMVGLLPPGGPEGALPANGARGGGLALRA